MRAWANSKRLGRSIARARCVKASQSCFIEVSDVAEEESLHGGGGMQESIWWLKIVVKLHGTEGWQFLSGPSKCLDASLKPIPPTTLRCPGRRDLNARVDSVQL